MQGDITALGLGSGLHLQDILDKMRKADEVSIDRLKNEKTTLNKQVAAFEDLDKSLLDIKNQSSNLSMETTFISRTSDVSNPSVLKADVSEGAPVGNHEITVTQLATYSTWAGAGVAQKDSVINDTGGDETFAYHLGNGATVSVNVPDQTTLQGLADIINSDPNNPGVTAKIINTGDATNPYQLVLQANNTGEDSRITVDTQLSSYAMTEIQGANGASLNAQLTVDGISYQRDSNSNITDIIGGVSLNLLDTGSTSLGVEADHKSVESSVENLVGNVNKVIEAVQKEAGYDENGKPELLTNVGVVRSLKSRLINMLGTPVNVDGKIHSLYDLGLEVNRDGTVSIDQTKLEDALNNDYDDVKKFFLGDTDKGIKGFGDIVNDTLRDLTDPGTGALETQKTSTEDRIKRIDNEIASSEQRLDKKYDILARQFADLDKFMSNMQNLSSYLTSQFNSLSGNKSQ